jgi:hypothetical protein
VIKIHVDAGRLQLTSQLSSGEFGLNIGCGKVHFPNKIGVDLSRDKSEPQLLASVHQLPFCDGCFKEIIFTEVLEHVSQDSEVNVLKELARVLDLEGQIILSTPNKTLSAVILDPMFPLIKHRHYDYWKLLQLCSAAGFFALKSFTAGKLPFGQPTMAYALNFLFLRKKFDFCAGLCTRAFNQSCGLNGSTIFLVLKKKTWRDNCESVIGKSNKR